MSHEFDVKCLYRSEMITATINVTQIERGENLLEYRDSIESWSDKDTLLFVSFCKLRKHLKEREKILLCKGCRRNVHPSGFQLPWMYALVLTKGKRVDWVKDKVLIFDEEPELDQIVSVEEQEKFYQEWWQSVMGNSIDQISFGTRILSFFSSLKNIFKKGAK